MLIEAGNNFSHIENNGNAPRTVRHNIGSQVRGSIVFALQQHGMITMPFSGEVPS